MRKMRLKSGQICSQMKEMGKEIRWVPFSKGEEEEGERQGKMVHLATVREQTGQDPKRGHPKRGMNLLRPEDKTTKCPRDWQARGWADMTTLPTVSPMLVTASEGRIGGTGEEDNGGTGIQTMVTRDKSGQRGGQRGRTEEEGVKREMSEAEENMTPYRDRGREKPTEEKATTRQRQARESQEGEEEGGSQKGTRETSELLRPTSPILIR